jgi:hypothetical protein
LAPAGFGLPLVVLALEVALAWSYRGAFRAMLRARALPDVADGVSVTHAPAE